MKLPIFSNSMGTQALGRAAMRSCGNRCASRVRNRGALCLLTGLCASAALAGALGTAQIVDLGPLSQGNSEISGGAFAVNDRGTVVGEILPPGNNGRAFVYSKSTRLTLLEPLNAAGASAAYGINDSGEVVGEASVTSGASLGFLYTSRMGMQPLGTLGGTRSTAYAINNAGQIVGSATFAADQLFHPTLWWHAKVIDLGSLGDGSAVAYGINDAGQIVGSYGNSGSTGAFLYVDGAMSDIGTLGGVNPSYAVAYSINNAMEIVGYSMTPEGRAHGFLYTQGKLQDLGSFGFMDSSARGINDHGQIVGKVWPSGNNDSSAVLFFRGNGLLLLSGLLPADAGWVLTNSLEKYHARWMY